MQQAKRISVRARVGGKNCSSSVSSRKLVVLGARPSMEHNKEKLTTHLTVACVHMRANERYVIVRSARQSNRTFHPAHFTHCLPESVTNRNLACAFNLNTKFCAFPLDHALRPCTLKVRLPPSVPWTRRQTEPTTTVAYNKNCLRRATQRSHISQTRPCSVFGQRTQLRSSDKCCRAT